MARKRKFALTACMLFLSSALVTPALATGHSHRTAAHKTRAHKSGVSKKNQRSSKRHIAIHRKKWHMTPTRAAGTTIASAHQARLEQARKTAMTRLMNQLGKPYRWGGSSPRTGFDCSGLVWYAYKDLVNIRIPRTANEMYHLRDAATVNRDELQRGDLVFFRIRGRGAADHVGVYVGNGKFIQSPRTGRDIRITSLSDDYWQRHYIGARRVMTPDTLR
ncbi:peptidoglycan endopeptidase [Erwinia sp. CPCC 100877]|nr:peptidoglycan endopeptidase [Erwinia sp. CPCC 100877]